MVKAQNTESIAAATGRQWADWLDTLDDAGADELKHSQIARLAGSHMPPDLENAGWWAQGVAVAYEQARGLRVPGQASDGTFTASASKTYRGYQDDALAAWLDLVADREEFNGIGVVEAPSTSSTPKWRYWRVKLTDGSRVSVGISSSGEGRASLGLEHAKLDSPEDIDYWKPYWKALLAEL